MPRPSYLACAAATSLLLAVVPRARAHVTDTMAAATGTVAAAGSATFSHDATGASDTADKGHTLFGPDKLYPGTAWERRAELVRRAKSLTARDLSRDWYTEVRPKLLWAAGLKDVPEVGHAFNDYNHVDITPMMTKLYDAENEGRVDGIAQRNPLGRVIRIASEAEAGPGGSWSTCMIGCQSDPPKDVAHIQFEARIAFKLVWAPMDSTFDHFVLVGDDGEHLASGAPTGRLPDIRHREYNFKIVEGSKYAVQADLLTEAGSIEAFRTGAMSLKK